MAEDYKARAEAAEAQVAALWVSVNSMQQLAQRALAEPISADTEALVEICTVADDVLTPEIASTSKAYEKRIKAEAAANERRKVLEVMLRLLEAPTVVDEDKGKVIILTRWAKEWLAKLAALDAKEGTDDKG
jgi:hypothetical protein